MLTIVKTSQILRVGATVLTAFSIFISGCSTPVRQAEVKEAIQITQPSLVKPIAITKVAASIRRGTVIGKMSIGAFCIGGADVKWKSGSKINLGDENLVDVFREELERNGWPVVGSTEDLFEGYDVSGAEVLVAARLNDISSEFCAPLAGFGNFDTKGSMRVTVEWQVYSPARRELIGKIETEGSAIQSDIEDDTGYALLEQSFGIAVNNLLSKKEFHDLVSRSQGKRAPSAADITKEIQNQYKSRSSLENALDAAKKSTVTVRTARGHGSGFSIGSGEMILTNAHVVGDAQTVSIVTNDGLQVEANVSVVSKERDVAMLMLSAVRLPALHLNTIEPVIGTQIYAIGSPIQESLSGTVTSGIVSGTRFFEGMQWIQSDVAINPGNSGGPVIGSDGSVVGISTAGIQVGGTQSGLNLLIPIKSALDYLGVKAAER